MVGNLAALRRQLVTLQAGLVSAEAAVQRVRDRVRETEAAIVREERRRVDGETVTLGDWSEWMDETAAALRDPGDRRVLVYAPEGSVSGGQASTPQTRALSRAAFHAAEMGDVS